MNGSEMIRKFFILLRHSAISKHKGEPRNVLMFAGFTCTVLHRSDFCEKFVCIYFVYIRYVFNSNFLITLSIFRKSNIFSNRSIILIMWLFSTRRIWYDPPSPKASFFFFIYVMVIGINGEG